MKLKLLKENPDKLVFNDETLLRYDNDVFTFGYYSAYNRVNKEEKIFFLIDQVNYHGTLRDNWSSKYPDYNYPDRLNNHRTRDGRFWKNKKVISVWDGIKKNDLNQLIKDIYKETKIKIDDNWYIEISTGPSKFKKIGEYLGHHTIKKVDVNDRHLLSPMAKIKKDVDGFGSDKYDKLARGYNYNSVAQMNYLNKNKYLHENKLSLSQILRTLII